MLMWLIHRRTHNTGIQNFKFSTDFFNWIISVIYGAKFTNFRTCIAEGHSEGTVSQIFYLGPSYY